MGDLIERGALLKLLEEWLNDPNRDHDAKDVVSHMIGIVKGQQAVIVYDKPFTDYLERWGFKLITHEALEAIERKMKGEWIPTSKRLPKDGEWAIFTDGENTSVERFKADAINHFFPQGRWFELEDAIAWMPLPGSYKEGKEHEGDEEQRQQQDDN